MNNINNLLKEYARLAVVIGANVQKNQLVMVNAPIEAVDFVRMIVEEAYIAGAKRVMIEWQDSVSSRLFYEYGTEEALTEMPDFVVDKLKYFIEQGGCAISVASPNPDAFKGIDPMKMMMVQQATAPKTKFYSEHMMASRSQWTIVAYPNNIWAKKVFPGCNKTQAMEKMWEAILSTSRVNEDPCAAWDEHNRVLAEKCNHLNSLKLKTLHYTSKNGTDLTVGLLPNVLWMGGGEHAQLSRIYFNPNIPSEECFTSPKKGVAEGIVYSSKPLSYSGEIIDKFWIRFKDGKAVEWGAEKNADLLGKMLTIDENAGYLGECALIAYDSPINNTGILFYNTLFDENASCHLAIGRGFTNLVEGYENYTTQELIDMGINYSLTHVDFMIGTDDLCIEGETYDGKKVTIFKDGNWAF